MKIPDEMMSGYDLAYAALAVRDVAAADHVLGDILGLDRIVLPHQDEQVPTFGVGRTALAVFPVGDPFLAENRAGVDHIALAAPDPESAAEACGLLDQGVKGAGLGSARQVAIDRAATAGLAVRFTTPLGLSGTNSGRIERIDHLGIASADNQLAETVFHGQMGFAIESRQTDMEVRIAVESFTSDKYGAVYRNREPVPVGGLRVSFITVGDCELEFLQNFDPGHTTEVHHGTAGNTKQDQGAIAGYVMRYGAGLHHIALKTPDINEVLGHLYRHGCRMIDVAGRPGSRRSLIGFVHPSTLGGVLLHFVERPDLDHA